MCRSAYIVSRILRSMALLAAVAAVTACGGEEVPELGVHTAAVIGGSPDDEHRAVGRILFHGSFICTGTLIGANLAPYVLTAAHCLRDPETKEIFSPDSISVEFIGEKVFGAAMVNPHPEADPENYENDIGIIELLRMPTHVTPATLASAGPSPGMQVTVVGYGATEESAAGAGLHAATTSIEAVRGHGYDLTSPTSTTSAGGGSFCGGDSGGPTFTTLWGGKELVLGVHSAIKTTSFDVGSAGEGPDSSDTNLCADRRTFDVSVAKYLNDNERWIWDVTETNILTYDVPVSGSTGGASSSDPGDNVQAVVCGTSGAAPSAGFVAIALVGLGMAVRRRGRRRRTRVTRNSRRLE